MNELSIAQVEWNDVAAVALAPVCASPVCSVASRCTAVMSGREMLFAVLSGQAVVGWFILRVEAHELGKEAVIVAAVGELAGVSLMRSTLPAIEQIARSMHCGSIRIHSQRPGMWRELISDEFDAAEIVYRKAL